MPFGRTEGISKDSGSTPRVGVRSAIAVQVKPISQNADVSTFF